MFWYPALEVLLNSSSKWLFLQMQNIYWVNYTQFTQFTILSIVYYPLL